MIFTVESCIKFYLRMRKNRLTTDFYLIFYNFHCSKWFAFHFWSSPSMEKLWCIRLEGRDHIQKSTLQLLPVSRLRTRVHFPCRQYKFLHFSHFQCRCYSRPIGIPLHFHSNPSIRRTNACIYAVPSLLCGEIANGRLVSGTGEHLMGPENWKNDYFWKISQLSVWKWVTISN